MNLPSVCRAVESAVCHIVIETEDAIASAGTGVYIGNGEILTARHVLFRSSGKPFSGFLSLRTSDGTVTRTEAKADFPTLNVNVPTLLRPIPIDLAVLRPVHVSTALTALPLAPDIAERGTEVIIAGFTDEIPYPLDFADSLESLNPDTSNLCGH